MKPTKQTHFRGNLCLLAFAITFCATAIAGVAAVADTGGEHAATRLRIVLVGDSTLTDNAGWGLGFNEFLTEGAECINRSLGGRSSESYRREGRWTNALALKADYYLIQFGHNNEPGKPGRSTDMPTFVSNMVSYVEEARAIGAKPVLITPLTRRQWDTEHPGKIKSSLTPYAEEVRKIATSKQVPLVDLHARSIELCEALGPEKCLAFSPPKLVDGTNTGGFDGTHLNAKGRVPFARLVVEELRKAVPELAPVLRGEPVNPKPTAKEVRHDAVVSADGSGTHATIQAAVDAAPAKGKPFVILVKPGRYSGHVVIPASRPFVTFRGEPDQQNQTIITGGRNFKTIGPDGKAMNARDSSTVLVQGANFTAENISFENTTAREEKVQALAMYVEADRAVFRNCRFLGWQDTLRSDAPRNSVGRQYYADCYIEGHVDFIYAAGTAVFDRCHIQVKADGYITAASTPAAQPFGYVFLDCKVTAGAAVAKGFYLGRPWRPYAATTFVRCELPAQVRPEGWHNWSNPTNELTARYSEYQSTGPGANPQARVKWSRQLTDEQAGELRVEKILGGTDGWDPRTGK